MTQDFITEFQEQDISGPAYLLLTAVTKDGKKVPPAEIVGMFYRQVAHWDDSPVLCYKVRTAPKEYSFVPLALNYQVIDQFRRNYYCRDCSKDTMLNAFYDQYMVTDGLWRKYGAGGGMLCITCFQARTGRQLVRADFSDHSINTSNRFVKSLTQ